MQQVGGWLAGSGKEQGSSRGPIPNVAWDMGFRIVGLGSGLHFPKLWTQASLCYPLQEGSLDLMSPQEKSRGNLLSHTKKGKGGQKMELVVTSSGVHFVTETSSWVGSQQKGRACGYNDAVFPA